MDSNREIDELINMFYGDICLLVMDEDEPELDENEQADLVRDWAYTHKDELLRMEADE